MPIEVEKLLQHASGPDVNRERARIFSDIVSAKELIGAHMVASPLRRSLWLSELVGADVWLKLECLNPKGSFKLRGALNAISKRLKNHTATTPLKVCAASAGNHAQGVALAAQMLGCEAHIFLPRQTPIVKRQSTEQLGAKVYLAGDCIEDALDAAVEFANRENAELIHAFNDYDMITGNASCALEAFEQYALETGQTFLEIDSFLCSIGGGGLAAGAGVVMKHVGKGDVIGVEQALFNSASKSFSQKDIEPISNFRSTTIADGIAIRRIGNLTHQYINATLSSVKLVSDDDIVVAVLGLCERERIVAEGAGAAAVAALIRNKETFAGKKVIVVVSGGNIDPQLLGRVFMRGLTISGRLLNLTARIVDRPGNLKGLLEQIALLDVNVIEVHHDRTYSQVNVGDVGVELALETKNFEHQDELIQRLGSLGYNPIPSARKL